MMRKGILGALAVSWANADAESRGMRRSSIRKFADSIHRYFGRQGIQPKAELLSEIPFRLPFILFTVAYPQQMLFRSHNNI
jgi:hypothetical protein